MAGGGDHRLVAIRLDAGSWPSASPETEDERRVAINDILENNVFHPLESERGPYELSLSLSENRLNLGVRRQGEDANRTYALSLNPLKRVIKDYFLICDSYREAIHTATVQQIESIDMGRRSLHDEAGELLRQRLDGKIEMDGPTARRLFTLICALMRRSGPV